ncbi:YrhB domain-containing protein [Kordia sp.]|uniref:YrhB domain-containing protein n=1 Tax=Kordia sp. TaxID=1965332 RepID=UPI003D6B9503
MLTNNEMLEIAEKYLKRMTADEDDTLVIESDQTIKKPYGNIYYFDYKKYLETGDFAYAAVGSAPFLVEKDNRRVVQFGTAGSLEYQLEAYENETMVPALDTYWYPDEDRFSHK